MANQVQTFEYGLSQKFQCKAKIKIDDVDNTVDHTNNYTHSPSQINCESVQRKISLS